MALVRSEYRIVKVQANGEYKGTKHERALLEPGQRGASLHIDELGAVGWEWLQVIDWDPEAGTGWVVFRRDLDVGTSPQVGSR